MDPECFPMCLDLVAHSGYTLSLEKACIIQTSLAVLQSENHFTKIYFWGTIFGTQGDYHISYGFKKDLLKGRVYYYSTNGINWVLLPKAEEEHFNLALISTNRFEGDPSNQVEVIDDQPTEQDMLELLLTTQVMKPPQQEQEETKDDLAGGDFNRDEQKVEEEGTNILKEEDRLAAVVKMITREAALVPRGALFRHPNGAVVPNQAFRGLTYDDAPVLTNYFHFRVPLIKWEENVAKRPDYNYSTDFLDSIEDDLPIKGAWSFQTVDGKRTVILRSLSWLGMTFYHNIETHVHGFVYFGIGKKNLDIPFMLN